MNLTPVFSLLALTLPSAALAGNMYREDPAQIACVPKTFRPGSTLSIHLGPKHGREMSIGRDSDRTMFMVVVGSPPPDAIQLMTTDELAKARVVNLPADFEGTTWDARPKRERVFGKPGPYRIWVSENLETEATAYFCRITVVGQQ